MRATRTVVRPGRENGNTTLVFEITQPVVLQITVVRVFPSCERVGRFSVRARPGLNRIRFNGRLRGRALSPGGYRLIVRARGARRDVAAVPIVVANGTTTAAEVRRARIASVCTEPIGHFGADESTPASAGSDDDGVVGAALTALKAPVAGAARVIISGAKGVSRTAKGAAQRVGGAAADPFEDRFTLTVVGLLMFAISLLGLLVLTHLVRAIGHRGAGSREL